MEGSRYAADRRRYRRGYFGRRRGPPRSVSAISVDCCCHTQYYTSRAVSHLSEALVTVQHRSNKLPSYGVQSILTKAEQIGIAKWLSTIKLL